MGFISKLQKNQLYILSQDLSYNYNLFSLMHSPLQLYGLDLAQYGEVAKLDKSSFAKIDLELYPPHREHFLIHALQFQQKLPSEVSMLRSQRRNQRKSGVQEANKKVGRKTRVIHNPKRERRGFRVPEKTMAKPIRRKGRWIPGRQSRSNGTRAPRKARTALKQRKWAFKISNPEKIALKCARAVCKQNLQKWRKEHPPIIEQKVQATPAYFLKKKANQKRRRLQKHNLIKKNRKALIQIYGSAIFQRGWPVSRGQIKAALGIKQQDHLIKSIQGLSDLVQQH